MSSFLTRSFGMAGLWCATALGQQRQMAQELDRVAEALLAIDENGFAFRIAAPLD